MQKAVMLVAGLLALSSVAIGSDFAVLSITSPPDTVLVDSFFTPAALIKAAVANQSETTLVRMTIGVSYDDTAIAVIPAGDTLEVTFSTWQAQQSGSFTARCSLLTPDGDTTNDTGTKQVRIVQPGGPGGPPGIEWERVFQSRDTWLRPVIQTGDGSLVTAGGVSLPQDPCNTLILKMNSAGNTIWCRTIDAGWEDCVSSVMPTADGGFVMAGTNGDEAESVTDRIMVLKVDSLGTQQWKYSAFPGATVYTAEQTSDGGYITGGLWCKYDSLYMLKLDSSGCFAWRKSYGGLYGQWNAHIPVKQTSDGGYIVAAEVLLKTDSLGNQQWAHDYAGVRVLFSVQETPDGGYVAAGLASAPPPLQHVKPYNMVLLKTNPAGALQWKTVFTDGDESGARWVEKTRDGGYVVGGDIVIEGISHGHIWKIDSLGNVVWTGTYGERTVLQAGQQTADGGFIISSGNQRLWKLAPQQ